jgi:DNA-binding MarR family transcriptional regulator
MSQGKFTVMMLLNRQPEQGVNPSELADRAGVTRATMTGLLEGLEREKMITRSHDRQDRRRAVVKMTASARSFMDRLLPDYYTKIHELMTDMTEEDKRQLTRLLNKIGRRIPKVRTPVEGNGKGASA